MNHHEPMCDAVAEDSDGPPSSAPSPSDSRSASGVEAQMLCPRTLIWTWCSPFEPSGSPAIVAEILKRIPTGKAMMVCEARAARGLRRSDSIPHPITESRITQWLWPFRRGAIPRRISRLAMFPVLVLEGLRRIYTYRPEVILTIYADSVWILSSYLLSKLTRTPVVFFVHDPFREKANYGGGLNSRLADWLEPRSLRHGEVVVLYESLKRHYANRYELHSTVVRHLAPRATALAAKSDTTGNRKRIIGFAGCIYDNNQDLVRQLIHETQLNGRFEIRVWTSTRPELLADIGADSPHVTVAFESDYMRLLHHLNKCDLLYLPLGFKDTPSLPTASLKYVLPTKSVDYLLSGVPILVHCPAEYETSAFFRSFKAGHCLNDDAPQALAAWLTEWYEGHLATIDTSDVRMALNQFSAEENAGKLFKLMAGSVDRQCRAKGDV